MSRVKLLAAAIILVALAACGPSSEGSAPPTPTPTPTEIPLPDHPAAGFDVLITDQDRDVAVRLGRRVEVFLRARPGMTAWSGMQVDDPRVLSPIATGTLPVQGATIAGYVASSAGVANITAYATVKCAANQACPMLAMLFQVRVTVS